MVLVKGYSSSFDPPVGLWLTENLGTIPVKECRYKCTCQTRSLKRRGAKKGNVKRDAKVNRKRTWGRMKRETRRHSERVQTQWNTPEPDPEAEHQRPRLSNPQSTPRNPAHGLHTIHTLLTPSWKHILASTSALSSTHTPSTPTHNH